MIDKNKLLQVSEIISHASCPDGTGAAMICTAAYVMGGMKPPPVSFVKYDTHSHDDLEARPLQMFVDITPPKKRWEEWRGLSPIILDHHGTVEHIVHSLDGVYGNTDYSGAMLAFENVMAPLAEGVMSDEQFSSWKRFAHLCMIRDTWKSASPDWEEACALAHALLLYGHKWAISAATIGVLPMEELRHIGSKLYDKIIRQAKGIIRNSTKKTLVTHDNKEITIVFFNLGAGMTISDIAHEIMDKMPCDAVMGFFFTEEDGEFQCVISARSNKKISVSSLAESFGGGGHSQAAGFRIREEMSPIQIIEMISGRIATI